jgi:hypothetical protein
MRAREFIVENKCVPGWQGRDITVLPGNLGSIIIGKRLSESCDVVEVQLLYYNKNINIDVEGDKNLVYGIRIKNNRIIEYDHQMHPTGKDIGKIDSISNIQEYFSRKVSEYLNNIIEESMNNSRNLFDLVPELKNKIHNVLSEYIRDNPLDIKKTSFNESNSVELKNDNKKSRK